MVPSRGMMSEFSDWIWLAARLLTLEQGVALLRREYLPTLSNELRERDEKIISLIEADLKKNIEGGRIDEAVY